jgi:hypothetical protein
MENTIIRVPAAEFPAGHDLLTIYLRKKFAVM